MLTAHEGTFSQIETDLMRKQCLELYEAIGQLQLLNSNSAHLNLPQDFIKPPSPHVEPIVEISNNVPEILEEEPISENVELEEVQEIVEEIEPEIEPIPQIEIPEEKIIMAEPRFVPVNKLPDESKVDEKNEIISPPTIEVKKTKTPQFVPVEEKPDPIYIPVKKVITEKSVLEKIGQEPKSKTVHEHISSTKEEKLLHDTFPNSKIPTIPSAIDISKRFELQNNLFGGQSHAYSQAIRSLEEADNKQTALDVFEEISGKLNWDVDSELVKEFKSYIYRKF